MDLWQLNIFCKVIEYKGFTKAAEVVHLSQPTVSSHIKDLEKHFNCPLIDRVEKKAYPTKAGEILYDYAKRLLILREKMESALAEFQGGLKGRLQIGGSTIPGGYILPKLIGEFRRHYSEVMVSLRIGDTRKIIQDLLSGELELGIVGTESDDIRIEQKKLMADDLRLIVPKCHQWADKTEIDVQSLLNEPFIVREIGSGTLASIQKSLAKKDISREKLNIAAELGSTAAVIQGIKANIGISILSPIAVAEDLQTGKLKALKIKGLNLKRNFYLSKHKARNSSPLCLAFEAFITSCQFIVPDLCES